MPAPKKKALDSSSTAESTAGAGVVVRPKKPFDWDAALELSRREHWRRLEVTIQLREWLLAGKPATLDAAKAMLRARGLEDAIEAVDTSNPEALAAAAAEVVDEGLCEFHRRPEKPGLWFPTNHIKAGVKENWSVLGYRKQITGSRGALAEGLFIHSSALRQEETRELDWISLGSAPDGVYTAVAHTTGPRGPVSSIKRHEYVIRPTITFVIVVAHKVTEKIPDQEFADMLVHFGEHGLGACRSQGFGRFDVLRVREITKSPYDKPVENTPEEGAATS